jgi:hypothetical protein
MLLDGNMEAAASAAVSTEAGGDGNRRVPRWWLCLPEDDKRCEDCGKKGPRVLRRIGWRPAPLLCDVCCELRRETERVQMQADKRKR